MKRRWLGGFGLLTAFCVHAGVREVGPNRKYPTPCKAIAAAKSGDRIEIDAAGTYQGDVCGWHTDNLTIVGVNGRPVIDAAGRNAQGKGTWVISGSNTTVENIEFTGAQVSDNNGAAIRQEGPNLTVRHCFFHHNEEGILTGADPSSRILVENTEFAANGYEDGLSHNIYVGRVAEFRLQYSYSHDAISGHLVKSRARRNFIFYNRLSGETGTGSYELDLPNGGLSYVIGNLIEQGPQTENPTMVSYAEEGASNPDSYLYFINNTLVNHRADGLFLAVTATIPPPLVQNNIFSGPGEMINRPVAKLSNNVVKEAGFVNPDDFDYHLTADSAARDAGVDPGSALRPVFQYVHPTCFEVRQTQGAAIDAGAFEFEGGKGAAPSCGGASVSGPGHR
jgi:Right handed beta helix region